MTHCPPGWSQHAYGTFSPYGATGYPVLKYMAEHGTLDKEGWPEVCSQLAGQHVLCAPVNLAPVTAGFVAELPMPFATSGPQLADCASCGAYM